jgi:hypothetical protein
LYRLIVILAGCILMLAACQPEEMSAPPQITIIPFPTVTPGSAIEGYLPTPSARTGFIPMSQGIPTATPMTEICPDVSEAIELDDKPQNVSQTSDVILNYLSDGGSIAGLEMALRDDWDVFGESGFIRADVDLTGTGQPEVIIGYADDESAKLLILGCDNGRYVERYRAENATRADDAPPSAPVLIAIRDINQNGMPDVVYALQHCEQNRCDYHTQVIAWQANLRRFAGLISGGSLSDTLPELIDTDDDQILELVVQLESVGDITTGPLRTGMKIYDWNGTEYILSVIQPDPLRYQIQVIHEADRYLVANRFTDAIQLYQRALTDDSLRVWLRNEAPILESYILYRMLLARAAENQMDSTLVYDRIIETFNGTEDAPPIYVAVAQAFWDEYIVVADVRLACATLRERLTDDLSEAVTYMNRYGNRNPEYTAQDICPF